jgi:hypothetical protein
MFYLLLIIPHVLALGGLFAYAFYSNVGEAGDDEEWGYGGDDGGQQPPPAPDAGPGGGDLPLPKSSPPRRRLVVGEQLADLHPRPARREHDPVEPQRSPAHG